MQEKPITYKELAQTIKKMAIESGLSEEELDRFLERYAFEHGRLILLRNLVGADFDLEVSKNSIEYMRSRRPVLDTLSVPFKRGERVLSIGCGSGVAEVNLAQEGCDVWGLDPHKTGIRIAKRLADEVALSENCRFLEVSGYEYPFEDEFFDAVLYSHSIHEIDDVEASLKESHRVLKPDGRVVILEDGNTRDEVMEPIKKSGFSIKDEKSMPLGGVCTHGSVTSIIAITLEKRTR